jgi:hypothetical protein
MGRKRSEFLELLLIRDGLHEVTNEELAIQAAVTYYSGAVSARTIGQLRAFFRSMPRRSRANLVHLLKDVGIGLYRQMYDEAASMYLVASGKFKEEFLPPAKKEWPFPIYDGKGEYERNYFPRSDQRRANFRLVKKS